MSIKGYWRLNGNSNDASGNGNNGTDTNITYSQANGRLNQGAGFNGTSSKIIIPIGTVNYSGDQTINCWVKIAYQLNNPTAIIIQKGSDYNASGTNAYGRGIQISYETNSGGSVKFTSYAAVTNGTLASDYGASDNGFNKAYDKWYMLTVIYSKTNARLYLYIDGKLTAETVITNNSYNLRTSPSNGYGLLYGAYISNTGTAGYFGKCSIDELIIDNTAWSAAKVKNEYSKAKGFF